MPHQAPLGYVAMLAAFVGLGLFVLPGSAQTDAPEVEALFKENDCHKCHHPTRSKKGPALQKIAEKYKGKADAGDKVVEQMSKGGKVKLDDGTEDDHKIIDVKDPKIRLEIAKWILSH
ncbi:MAG: c-type cytochrome [Alphaproteobacteria bacterium]|nr:c-type cytochrome [Alphaproteobacteria bacterium]